MCICRERNGKRTPKELETKRTGTNEHVSADVHFNTVETGFEQQLGFEKNRQSDLQKRLTQAEREIAQLRRHLQGAAAGCAQGFVKCFLRVPQAVGLYHRENQSAEAAAIYTICKLRRLAGGFLVLEFAPISLTKPF